jgi:CheY-like chemotaxis protein
MSDPTTNPPAVKGGGQEKLAVLCVDADRDANATVGRIIAGDADLWEAFNFKTAIEAINRRPFALVICDVTAGDLRGLDVLSILASLYPSTPAIVTSAEGAGGWTAEAFEGLGAVAALMKPYHVERLRRAVNSALWPVPVMGKGDVGRAVLLQAAIHEPAASELENLTPEERGEVRTVAEVLERLLPFMEAGGKAEQPDE